MSFDSKKCYIPTVYCGNKEKQYPYYENENKYIRKGTTEQCLKKGFGAALAQENKKRIPLDSLQQIRYVGVKFEEDFKENGIHNIPMLIQFVKDNSVDQIDNLLTTIFTNSNGTLNTKGLNSTLLYLFKNGNSNIPQCKDYE